MVSAAVILLAYLLAQVAAICLRLRWRARFETRVRTLYADVFFPIPHWRKVEFYKHASRGGWASLRRFARTPARLFSLNGPPPDPEEDDPIHPLLVGLRDVHNLASKLEWAAHPVAFVLMAACGVLSLLAGQVVGLAKGARPRMSTAAIRRAATGDLLLAARVAFDRRLTPAELLGLQPNARGPAYGAAQDADSVTPVWNAARPARLARAQSLVRGLAISCAITATKLLGKLATKYRKDAASRLTDR